MKRDLDLVEMGYVGLVVLTTPVWLPLVALGYLFDWLYHKAEGRIG